jgi:hypothetical protein
MEIDDRMATLRDTLGRITKFATILSPSGISVRVLHCSEDTNGRWDQLKTVKEVNERMDRITNQPGTPLGTVLLSKVLKPMILDKANRRALKKPVIVTIITDGEESGDSDTSDLNFLSNIAVAKQRTPQTAER